MYRDRDFDPERPLPWNETALAQDLELPVLWNAMANGDEFLFEIARTATLTFLTDIYTILYRQGILKDVLKHPALSRSLYTIAVNAIEAERKQYWGLGSRYPSSMLRRSLAVMEAFLPLLRDLREQAAQHRDLVHSEGLRRFFDMLTRELSDPYFATVEEHLRMLEFRDGVLISARLGEGNKGTEYVLRWSPEKPRNWLERIFAAQDDRLTFKIHPRDEAGWRALSALKDRGLRPVAEALAQSVEHILNFFILLRAELAFYVGCVNLQERLTAYAGPICFPVPMPIDQRTYRVSALYDPCLSLQTQKTAVGNDLDATSKVLVIVTGANQGGKSTFLRAVGVAQTMMQCGMFAAAEAFEANMCDAVVTHYKREEDRTMKSGKLDEELARMSAVVDHLTSRTLLLFNESFAATNEREGSEIARDITSALLERGVKQFFVTHLYEFARHFAGTGVPRIGFLRAERGPDGVRTFKLLEGPPLETSYGADLYAKIFGESLWAST